MRRLTARRFAAILLAGGALVAVSIPRVGYAAAPNVRIVTPANIDIDGHNGDWDSQGADFLSDMYQAGNPDKPVLSKLYGRYDCGTNTFYVHVVTVQGWSILPSDNDNYVKLGQTDKLVDGSDPPGGNPPSFAYIGAKAWEASFNLDPGSYLGDGGLNVHAEVQPDGRGDTSAVAGRRLDVVITCPNPTPDADAQADGHADRPAHADRARVGVAECKPVRATQRGPLGVRQRRGIGQRAAASASEERPRRPARKRRHRRARSRPPAPRRPRRRLSRARSQARAASLRARVSRRARASRPSESAAPSESVPRAGARPERERCPERVRDQIVAGRKRDRELERSALGQRRAHGVRESLGQRRGGDQSRRP